MCLREVLVLADEDNHRIPEVLGLVLLQPISNDFGRADICQVRARFCIDTEQEVDARTLEFISREKIIQLSPWRSKGLSGPVENLADAQALGVALRQKELDRG